MASTSSSTLRPSFFKPLIFSFSTILKLPDVFVRKYRDYMPENMKLRIATGKTWDVMLAEIDDDGAGEWYFTAGWNEFVRDLELKEMQMLVFWLNIGEATFDVSMYSTNTCERVISNLIPNDHLLTNVERGPRFEFVLTKSKIYKLALYKEFVEECGLKGTNSLVLQFPPKERYWSVIIEQRPQHYSVEMGVGWCDFRKENGLVIGNTYCFEFHRLKNVILVTEIN